jgi:hypothetical protein
MLYFRRTDCLKLNQLIKFYAMLVDTCFPHNDHLWIETCSNTQFDIDINV